MSKQNPIIGYHTSVSGSKKAQLLENEIKTNNSNGFPYLVNLYHSFWVVQEVYILLIFQLNSVLI